MADGPGGLESMVNLPEFYRDKRVLVTGHTGFKGGWLIFWLNKLGARVCGYGLEPSELSLYRCIEGAGLCESQIGDVADFEHLSKVFDDFRPEIVFHLAAQPIVREGYRAPRTTYLTNVMGTVNLLECVRLHGCVRSVVNVTTDKVYQNKEWEWGYRENEPLDGYDPYSNSKSCSELATHSYKNSFLDGNGVAVSTARAGNVIGGGDFAADRIIPDCVRAAAAGESIIVRNPYSVRPYQHVLEPLFAYLMIAATQYADFSKAGYYNVGPDEIDCCHTGELVDIFVKAWNGGASVDRQTRRRTARSKFFEAGLFETQKNIRLETALEYQKSGGKDCRMGKMPPGRRKFVRVHERSNRRIHQRIRNGMLWIIRKNAIKKKFCIS